MLYNKIIVLAKLYEKNIKILKKIIMRVWCLLII